jgi:hypothetical protein
LIRRTRSQRQRLSATQAGTRRWPVDHIDAKRNLRQPCQHSQFLAAPPCNFPKSSLQHPQSLPAPCGRENFFQAIETIRRFTGEIGLALPAFCENLPANRKLQGDPGRETVLLLTASSATQSGSTSHWRMTGGATDAKKSPRTLRKTAGLSLRLLAGWGPKGRESVRRFLEARCALPRNHVVVKHSADSGCVGSTGTQVLG